MTIVKINTPFGAGSIPSAQITRAITAAMNSTTTQAAIIAPFLRFFTSEFLTFLNAPTT